MSLRSRIERGRARIHALRDRPAAPDSLAGRLRALRGSGSPPPPDDAPPAPAQAPQPAADAPQPAAEAPQPAAEAPQPAATHEQPPPDSPGPSPRQRVAAALGNVRGVWDGAEPIVRQRIVAGLVVAAVAALIWFVLLPVAPCSLPRGDACAPADDAIAMVPDDALAYAHLDIDPESEQYEEAARLTERLPNLSALAGGGLAGLAGAPIPLDDIRSWAGGELAVALLPGGGAPSRVVLAEAADSEAATAFAGRLVGPGEETRDVGGVEVTVGRDGAAFALLEGFLLFGDEAAVSELVDPPSQTASLDEATGADVLDELPEERVAYGYLSGLGARALLSDRALEPLDTFVNSAASAGAAAALSVDSGAIELSVRSDLDPQSAQASPSFFSALPPFTPSLTADVGADALAYLGLGDPATAAGALVDRAEARDPGLGAALQGAARDLRKETGIDLREDLLPLLGSEAALTVQPVGAEAESAEVPGVETRSGVPFVSLIADGVDAEAAARSLGSLQRPLEKSLKPSLQGQVQTFETIQVAGVQAQSLLIGPAVDLTWATYDDRLVIATDPLGVEAVRTVDEPLSDAETFATATEGLPSQVSILAYIDLAGLLSLGEQAGLAEDPAYVAYAADLQALRTATLAVADEEDSIATDLRIATGETPEPAATTGLP